MEIPTINEAERTPTVVALLAFVDTLLQRVQALEDTNQKLRDEIAILKGQKPKPQIAPSNLEKPPPKPSRAEGEKRPGSEKRSKKTIARKPIEVIVDYPNPPTGAVSNGYEAYDVEELKIEGVLTRYWCQRIVMGDGRTLLAPLPADVIPGSHFGPMLTCYILYQYPAFLTVPVHTTQQLIF